ncbi:MAG: hypothetical protein ACOX87_08290 [Chloroflexota bacterium]|jgi:hypothetical protein
MANYKAVESLNRAVRYLACSTESPLRRLRTAYAVNLAPRYTRGWPQELQSSVNMLHDAMYEGIKTDADALKAIVRIISIYGEAERLYQQELFKEQSLGSSPHLDKRYLQ